MVEPGAMVSRIPIERIGYFRSMEMKELDKRIGELLYEHDCVIIPDFGGFIAVYKPAHIHPRLHLIEAPGKSISFNRKLLRNDGLIANYIAEQEGISYEAALGFISSTVKKYNHELNAGKRLEIEKVGVLFLDSEKRIQFIPDGKVNFLTESFGLQAAPLKELEVIEETGATVVPIASEKAGSERKWWVAAAAILVPVALVGTFLFQDIFHGGTSPDLAGLNPFQHFGKSATYQPITYEVPEVISEEPVSDLPGGDRVTFDFEKDALSETGIAVVEKVVAVEVLEPESIPSIPKSSNLNLYFVIAGAFEVEDNAHSLVSELKSSGYDAAIIGMRGRLHLVAYGAYSDKASARSALKEVQSADRSGWIYRK